MSYREPLDVSSTSNDTKELPICIPAAQAFEALSGKPYGKTFLPSGSSVISFAEPKAIVVPTRETRPRFPPKKVRRHVGTTAPQASKEDISVFVDGWGTKYFQQGPHHKVRGGYGNQPAGVSKKKRGEKSTSRKEFKAFWPNDKKQENSLTNDFSVRDLAKESLAVCRN